LYTFHQSEMAADQRL